MSLSDFDVYSSTQNLTASHAHNSAFVTVFLDDIVRATKDYLASIHVLGWRKDEIECSLARYPFEVKAQFATLRFLPDYAGGVLHYAFLSEHLQQVRPASSSIYRWGWIRPEIPDGKLRIVDFMQSDGKPIVEKTPENQSIDLLEFVSSFLEELLYGQR